MKYPINRGKWKIHIQNIILSAIILTFSLLAVNIQADIVVVVNPENPIHSLSKKDVQRLFLGRMHKFPDSDMKVEPIDNSEKSDDYENFYSNVINMNKSKLKRYRAHYLFSGKGRLPTQIKSTLNIVQYVSTTRNAIAYMDKNQVTEKVKIVYSY